MTTHNLNVARRGHSCASCPFGTREQGTGSYAPACSALFWLDETDTERPARPFLVWNEKRTDLIYPKDPPDWCPLRQGPITIRWEPKEDR